MSALLRGLQAPILHFSLVKAHGRASMSASRTGLKGAAGVPDGFPFIESIHMPRRYQAAQLAATLIIVIGVAIIILILFRGVLP